MRGGSDGVFLCPREGGGGYSQFFLLRRLGPSIPPLQKKYQKYQTYPKIIESKQPQKFIQILYLNLKFRNNSQK